MASTLLKHLLLFLSLSTSSSLSLNSSSSLESHLSSVKSVCKSTPYPDACFDSLKLSSPNFLNFFLRPLRTAITLGLELSNLFSNTNVIEKQRGTIENCVELHEITLASLQKILQDSRNLPDARVFLSAALTNKITCLEGLNSASGPLKPLLVNNLLTTYMHVSNSLSLLSTPGWPSSGGNRRRLLGFAPTQQYSARWLSREARRVLQSSGDDYDPSLALTVAPDGTGNFTTISDAINFAPNHSIYRTFIYIREGVYRENVHIPSCKTNIVLIGDGSDVTVITGNRSFDDGWTTYSTATVAVTGVGFLASGITFENTAGPANHQAVALLMNADLSALYRCTIIGYQDSLYVHAFRQFYRECDIYGTIDYIFGNAIAVFQGCNIVSRMPMWGQYIVITAQSRNDLDQETGIVIQNCTIIPTEELYNNSGNVKSYLGRPWRNYARTVYMESYIGDFIAPEGWIRWEGDRDGDKDESLDTLYYGEYENYGPGSSIDNRVSWPGYHVMEYDEASNFTVSSFISGEMWLDSTNIPYDDGV